VKLLSLLVNTFHDSLAAKPKSFLQVAETHVDPVFFSADE